MTETTPITAEAGSEEKNTPTFHASVERVSEIERKISVEIPWDDVRKLLDEAYRELQHGVTIKGFRRGKVPRRMLEQLFGKHVTKEVAQRMVQETLDKALRDNGISAVSDPQVVDQGIQEGEVFRYTAGLQVVPEIEPKDYFAVELKQRPAKVTEDDIDLALRLKQRELTDYRTIEGRNTQPGDVLLVDIMGKIGQEAYAKDQKLIELGAAPVEPLAGLAAKLTGISPEQKELELELDVPLHDSPPGGEPQGEGEGTKQARLLVTIHDVKQKVVPAIDDELARDTGEAQTLQELREVLRKKLLGEDTIRAREESKQELLRKILEKNSVPLVPALVERYLEQSMKLQWMLMGMDPEQISSAQQEPLKEHLRGEANEKVKAGILLEAIAKKESIEVVEADIEKKLSEIAATRGQNVSRVRSEYEKENRLPALRGRIREDKTLDLLMTKANIIEISAAEMEPDPNTPEVAAEPTSEGTP